MKLTGNSDAFTTAEFTEYKDIIFSCLNVANFNEGTRVKKISRNLTMRMMILD